MDASFHRGRVKVPKPLRLEVSESSMVLLYGYGSIPIHTIRGMNIHFDPAILMWTTGG